MQCPMCCSRAVQVNILSLLDNIAWLGTCWVRFMSARNGQGNCLSALHSQRRNSAFVSASKHGFGVQLFASKSNAQLRSLASTVALPQWNIFFGIPPLPSSPGNSTTLGYSGRIMVRARIDRDLWHFSRIENQRTVVFHPLHFDMQSQGYDE